MTPQDSLSRRAVLASTATAGLLAIAGCSGGDGATEGPSSATTSPTTRSPTATPADGGTKPTTESNAASLPTPTLGPSDAAVTVAAYESYLCGHCAHYNLNGLPKIRSEYVEPGTIRYEHHDFPLGEVAWYSAIAARSVQATVGQEAFWQYSKKLFANAQDTSMELYRSLATEVGADPDVVEEHVRTAKWEPVVAANRAQGKERGVSATPTFFVNGNEVDPEGHSSWYGAVSDAIDSALE
ncbi:MAG TPA: thioredoxin domain-containing protein [Natrialbaceae archaeon]|nr:thioredoxin domain-containing protein [Natrialbaceae archaeon]